MKHSFSSSSPLPTDPLSSRLEHRPGSPPGKYFRNEQDIFLIFNRLWDVTGSGNALQLCFY